MYTINRVSTLLLTHSLIRIVTYIGNSCNNNNRNLSGLLHIPTTHLLVTTQILFTELHSVHPQPPFVIDVCRPVDLLWTDTVTGRVIRILKVSHKAHLLNPFIHHKASPYSFEKYELIHGELIL